MAADRPAVTLHCEAGIAVITIDNPPINAGSQAVRAGLVAALAAAAAQNAAGAVLIGAGRVFVAGSDLKEFGQRLVPPELPDVIRAVEDAPFPVVAALHGVALGGGLELALGCDYRLAAPGTKIGLPEVSLGMVPGAGGTQRLTRRVGQSRAIDLICAARRIDAEEAQRIGAIDAVVAGDLLAGARAFLAAAPRRKRRVIGERPPAEDAAAIDAAAQRARQRGEGRPNIDEAIRLIRRAAGDDPADALADERAVFQRLRVGPDAFALRYLFFAERQACEVAGLDRLAARRVARVGIVGGGTMGQGIARAVLAAGLPVTIVERDAAARDRATAAILASLDLAASKGWLPPGVAAGRKALVQGASDIADLAGCDLVIEAVFEEMEIKRAVLAELDARLPPAAVIATNTSYLDVDAMAQGLAHPDRVLGLHFFSPADRMALIEVVRAARTSDAALATGLALARTLGKQPVVTRVGEGFVGNRIFATYRRRAELLVLDGAAPEQVDAAIRDFGFRMGPFEVADLSGLDIAWAMRRRLAATRDPQDRYVAIPDRLCEAGRLGRKAGRGWYDHAGDSAHPASEVAAIIDAERRAAGILPAPVDAETIRRQLLAAMVNEAACLVAEGIAQRVSDVDVALVNGYGFPRWRGGPVYWAAQEPAERIAADIAALGRAIGHGFRRGPVEQVLDQVRGGTAPAQ